jgi:hypothetical protein
MGELGRWRREQEGQRSGTEDVDLGGTAGMETSPGKKREIRGTRVGLLLLWWAEWSGCGEEDKKFVPG